MIRGTLVKQGKLPLTKMEMEVKRTPIAARVVVEYSDADTVKTGMSIENVTAYVVGVEAIAWLRKHGRLAGVDVGESDALDEPVLRLAMEEVAVGVSHGFLGLEMEDQALVDMISAALRATASRGTHPDGQELLAIGSLAALRARVFSELWQRGHFVAFGSKFGVDFLVYEADPRTCHSFAMVVVKGYAASFTTVDIVSHCRVAKMVKKQFLLASEVDAQIVYLSLDHGVLAASRQESR